MAYSANGRAKRKAGRSPHDHPGASGAIVRRAHALCHNGRYGQGALALAAEFLLACSNRVLLARTETLLMITQANVGATTDSAGVLQLSFYVESEGMAHANFARAIRFLQLWSYRRRTP